MPLNKIKQIDAIRKEMKMGWPYGTGTAYKLIPMLLARIDELELALLPFARVALINAEFHTPDDGKLEPVYFKDLINAYNITDPSNSVEIPRETFFDVPAE